MMSKTVIGTQVLPVVLFTPLMFAGYRFIYINLNGNGTSVKLTSLCDGLGGSSSRFLLTYTGIRTLDFFLCFLGEFFHTSLTPINFPFTSYLCLTLGIIVTIPFIEAARKGRPAVLGFPIVISSLSQVMSLGFTYSAYYLVFVLSGAARLHIHHRGDNARITRAHATATIYGYFVGMAVPTAAMLYLDHPYLTALWNPYPLFVAIARYASLYFDSPSGYNSSGYSTTQIMYTIGFISSAIGHFTVVLPRFGDLPVLRRILLPSGIILDPTTTPLEKGVIDIFQWDGGLCIIASMLATFWFARNIKQLVGIVVWHVVATVAFGPGAAIAGVFMWREALLNKKENGSDEKRT